MMQGLRWGTAGVLLFAWLAFYKWAKGKAQPDTWDFLGEAWLCAVNWQGSSAAAQRRWQKWCLLVGARAASDRLRQREQIWRRDVVLGAGALPLLLLHSSTLFGLGVALLSLRVFYEEHRLDRQVRRQQTQVAFELPDVLTNLLLALESGQILDRAWSHVAHLGEGPLYEEMQRVERQRRLGGGYAGAYRSFGQDWPLAPLREMGALLAKHVEKGGADLLDGLELLRKEWFAEQIRLSRSRAQRAAQEMLFPALLLFIGILLLVLVPLLGRSAWM